MSSKHLCIKSIGMTIFLSSLLLLSVINRAGAAEGEHVNWKSRNILDSYQLNKKVDSVMSTLSDREKIAQLMIIVYSSRSSDEKKAEQNDLIANEKIGGVIVMHDRLELAVDRTNEMHAMAPVPLLVTIDGEWGASMRFNQIPDFPRQMQMGALTSDTLVYEMGYRIGEECRDLNIHVNFAPDVDINNNHNNPVINIRSFGEDKHKVAQYGAAYLKGMNDAGVYGSAKHFPGHGDTDVDSHKALPVLTFPYERLDSLELFPFKHLIANNADMVMVGHLEVPSLDPTGTPASISKVIITDFLRNTLGYNGIIITDALNMKGVSERLPKKLIPLEAYKAGVDILLMPEDVKASITEIEKALNKGVITRQSLDERVRKMLELKVRAGMFEAGYNPIIDTTTISRRVIKNENKQFISKVAKHSLTVVTNNKLANGESVLPVKGLQNKKIAYLGYGCEKFGKECAEELMKYAKVDTIILRTPVKDKELLKAKEQLKDYDLVLLGMNNTDARPHHNFGLDSLQMPIITDWAKEQDMVVMYMGSPYALNKIEDYQNFKAFVVGYANNMANNKAMAQLVFGAIPAIGVLPVGTAEFAYGESVVIPETIRAEHVYHSNDSTYRMESGKIYGNHLVTAAGDTLTGSVPIDVNSELVNELFCDSSVGEILLVKENRKNIQACLDKVGMWRTKILDGTGKDEGKLFITTTLDDLTKLFYMLLKNGEYGGEVVMPENLRDHTMLKVYSIMMRDNGMKVGINGLRAWINADVVDIKYSFE